MRDCIVRVPPLTLFICLLADSVRGTEPKDCASRRKPQGLLCAKVLLPVGVEDGQGDAIEGFLGLQQVPSLKRTYLGFLWLAGG